jgi:hypothetical protein
MTSNVEANCPGVRVAGNSLLFDNECMSGKIEKKTIARYGERSFERIWIGYKKMYLGSVLQDLSQNFKPPETLDLDLFYGRQKEDGTIHSMDDLVGSEKTVRKIFSGWSSAKVKVVFRCNDLVMKTFHLG